MLFLMDVGLYSRMSGPFIFNVLILNSSRTPCNLILLACIFKITEIVKVCFQCHKLLLHINDIVHKEYFRLFQIIPIIVDVIRYLTIYAYIYEKLLVCLL